MRLKTLLLPALFLALATAASPALAQNRSESWEFGPYLVGFDFDSEIEIEDKWGAGFRFGYNFVPMHEIELSFEAVDTEDDVFHLIDVKVGQFHADYVFNFAFDRRQKVVPYLTAGIGYGYRKFFLRASSPIERIAREYSINSFTMHYGFGFLVRTSEDTRFNAGLTGVSHFSSRTGEFNYDTTGVSIGLGLLLIF